MNRIRLAFFSILPLLLTMSARADEIDSVIKKLEAKFDTLEAKPGQVVTLKITLQTEEGWDTYPTYQEDKGASSFVNKFILPKEKDTTTLFVGKWVEPPHHKTKADAVIGFTDLHYYPGGGTYEHKVVISPKATKGEQEVKISARLTICKSDDKCLAGKFDLTAKIKVLDAPAVEIEPKYKAEVEKLLNK